jgi:hypothetical protein
MDHSVYTQAGEVDGWEKTYLLKLLVAFHISVAVIFMGRENFVVPRCGDGYNNHRVQAPATEPIPEAAPVHRRVKRSHGDGGHGERHQ